MRLLITGADGQVGRELVQLGRDNGWFVIACNRQEMDISDRGSVSGVLTSAAADIVINAAAYTAVDRAETDQDAAFAVNHLGAQNLAIACSSLHIPLIHISTDYVFDGTKTSPYLESDAPNPLTVYGKSKLAGELAVLEAHSQSYILRTSWVFGQFGNNFVKTMLRLAKNQSIIKVVDDQHGSPTAASDIALCLLRIAENALGSKTILPGIYHFGGTPHTTWYEFSMSILNDVVGKQEYALEKIIPIPSSEYPTPAVRPRYTCLDNGKLMTVLDDLRADWRVNLHFIKCNL